MSDIVILNEGMYQYTLPKMPREKDIWYHDIAKKNQYWKTPHNKNFKWLNPDGTVKDVRKMKEKDKIEYIDYWRDKWENGLWVMINGEPTYINGIHVEHLVFNQFKSQHFIYLDEQRLRFYFRELTDKDHLCDGRCWIKCRRAGITAEQITHTIRVLISDYGNNGAYQSDTHQKADSTLLKPSIDTYIKRPMWMREHYYSSNGKIPRKELELTSNVITDNFPLGGKLRAFPSSPKAADGEEFMIVTIDEFSKHEGISPYETFEVNKKTIVNPGKRGKMDCLSTTGDTKDAVRAVRDWHKLIAESNPRIRNANGQTNSGLYEFFVDATNSMELIEKIPQVLNIYGKVNKEMAREYIWNDINKHPKNSKEYIHALYKMPLEKRHALLTATSNIYFSKQRITARLDDLRSLPKDQKPYVRGRFDEKQNGRIEFVADPEGHWLVAVHPYFSVEKNIDTRNRFRQESGVYFPPRNPEFGIGYDPIRYRKEDTTSTSLSDAAIVVAKKFDYYSNGESPANRYAAIYLFRPDDPNDAHKECIKAAKYFGAPVMHERVIESVKERFDEANMLPFLLRNEKDGKHGMWIDSQGTVVKNALEWMQSKFSAPKDENEEDQIELMPFEECLMDMDTFDIGFTTQYDIMMAMIELEYALKQINFTNLTDDNNISFLTIIQELNAPRK